MPGGGAHQRIVIVGAGPAGSAAAIELASRGHHAVLLHAGDRTRRWRQPIPETLPPPIEPALRRLGAWEAFSGLNSALSPGRATVWGAAEPAWRDAFTEPAGGGWVVQRPAFDAMLRDVAAAGGVDVWPDTWVSAIARFGDHDESVVTLRRNDVPEVLHVAVLIDATGRGSGLARRLGALRAPLDRLAAFGASMPATLDPTLHTLIEAVEAGWWFATSSTGVASATFFTDPDLCDVPGLMDPRGWYAALRRTRHLFSLLGQPTAPTAVAVRRAGSHCLGRVHGPGWIATGDAATAWDPLASAGVAHALRTGLEAAQALDARLDGRPEALRDYADGIARSYRDYRAERAVIYGQECRWPESVFWRRRSHATTVPEH